MPRLSLGTRFSPAEEMGSRQLFLDAHCLFPTTSESLFGNVFTTVVKVELKRRARLLQRVGRKFVIGLAKVEVVNDGSRALALVDRHGRYGNEVVLLDELLRVYQLQSFICFRGGLPLTGVQWLVLLGLASLPPLR